MHKQRMLLIGDHFIKPELMRAKLGSLTDEYEVIEAMTPFPLQPFENIAEVREASGSEEQMIELLQGVSVCVAHHAPFTERTLVSASDLRLVVVCRGGPVNVNVEAASRLGVTVAYTPARNATATAEHTVAMILSALRGIPQSDSYIRDGQWKGDYTWETAGFELETAVVGLIGYGAIGKLVGGILSGFGAKILVYDPFTNIDLHNDATQVELEDLLKRSNVVSLHARETKESRGILGARQIAMMQRGSIVVNCARGSLLDYDALADSLRSGHLFAAAVDVFPQEPLPKSSDLSKLRNLVMTCHIAGGTRQAAEKAATIAAEEVRRFIAGEEQRYCANPDVSAGVRC